ncbi:MAG: oligosaccharide flippase family protein [Acidobacteriota bacterium]
MSENASRRQLLLKNSLYGLFSWLFPVVPSVIAMPIIVKGLGNEMYGLYVVISGFSSYFFTIGIGKTAAKYVAEYKAIGETEKISDIVSATLILSLSLGFVATAVVVVLSGTIVTNVLLIQSELQNTAVTALYLACLTILVGTLSQIFQSILQGLQRFDRFLLLTNLSSLLFSMGSVIAVILGYGVLTILTLTLAVAGGLCLLSYWMAKKLLPELRFNLRVSGEAWGLVWRYATSIIVYQLCGSLLLLFERGWIVRKFGPAALTYYVVPMTLALYIQMFVGSLVLALFPTVNELLDEKEKLVTLYQKSTKLILSLVVFAVISAVVCGRLFLGIWLNQEFADLSYWLLVIHVFTFAMVAMNTIAWQVAESFRLAAVNAVATFIWMFVSIPLMVFLSDRWKTEGVAFARLIGVLIFIPLIIYVEHRFLDGICWRFWGSIWARIAAAGLFTCLVEWLLVSRLPSGWLAFVTAVVIGLLVYMAGLLFTGLFEADEKLLFRNAIFKYK